MNSLRRRREFYNTLMAHCTGSIRLRARRLRDVRLLRSFVGASLKLGNVWQSSDAVSIENATFSGSLFLGFDTPIGPLYVRRHGPRTACQRTRSSAYCSADALCVKIQPESELHTP